MQAETDGSDIRKVSFEINDLNEIHIAQKIAALSGTLEAKSMVQMDENLKVLGVLTENNKLIIPFNTPKNSKESCEKGQLEGDKDYIYFCSFSSNWIRIHKDSKEW